MTSSKRRLYLIVSAVTTMVIAPLPALHEPSQPSPFVPNQLPLSLTRLTHPHPLLPPTQHVSSSRSHLPFAVTTIAASAAAPTVSSNTSATRRIGRCPPWLPVPQIILSLVFLPLLSNLLPPLSISHNFLQNSSTTLTNSLLRVSSTTSILAATSATVARAQLGSHLIYNQHFSIPRQFPRPWQKSSLVATLQGPFHHHPFQTSNVPP